MFNGWNKTENESGYPCYLNQSTGQQSFNHPHFQKLLDSLEEYNKIKYSNYRIAFKVAELQKHLKVPPVHITSGVLSRHQLSLSESSLSLDTAELEAVLADVYFAAEKAGVYNGDIDLTVDLMINLLLNVYDKDRKAPIRVLAAKTLLILLSNEPVLEKWMALAQFCADHNGCVSSKRLAALLSCVAALPNYLGEKCDCCQDDVDACFAKSAGMLGVTARNVAIWGAQNAVTTCWLGALYRITSDTYNSTMSIGCAACGNTMDQGLKFKCTKCHEAYFCEKCYLYDNNLTVVSGHKKSHVIHEIVDGQIKAPECMSFIKGMTRLFFCTKTKKKKTSKPKKQLTERDKNRNSLKRRREGKPAMVTSTVGKASGKVVNNPANTLQDIIAQLETQNKALKDLSSNLENNDDEIKLKVEAHWNQISEQINRLKLLKDNITLTQAEPIELHTEPVNTQGFDVFSPIAAEDKKETRCKTQGRVLLSSDSGNFSVNSKQTDSQNLLTVSGDNFKPVVHLTSDTVSAVSLNDITSWYVDTTQDQKTDKLLKLPDVASQSLAVTEQRYSADIRSVETSNDKMKELNADLDTVLNRLQLFLTNNNFAMDDSSFDNNQLRETANEMENLVGSLIRGVEQRATMKLNGEGHV